MFYYAKIDNGLCVGYKIVKNEVDEDGYVLVSNDVDLNDLLYRKYDYISSEFSNEKYYPKSYKEPTEIEIIQEKISILEAENETLKQELSITQDAVNELIFNSLNI